MRRNPTPFRRCQVCGLRVADRAKRCECGSERVAWAVHMDVSQPGAEEADQAAVEAALDQHVPERRDAAGREHKAKLALIDATTERFRTRSEAMVLIGDQTAAATASIGAKLTAREATRAT